MNKELELLFENEHRDCKPWIRGKIPKHYKRLSVSDKEANRLARLGAVKIGAYFSGLRLFYSQAMIAGAILSGDYDEIIAVTPSQYGKTFVLGHVALISAYEGEKYYIAGAAANVTQMIMTNVISATQEAAPEVRNGLLNKRDEIDRLATSLSKTRLAFASAGFIEAITLGDTYTDNVGSNKAIGRAGNFMIDEAALVSEDAFSELGRREFAKIDGTVYKSVMISNPHKTGFFYDKLTQENPSKRTFILWMDALTAVEEQRFTKELVFNSDFAKNKSTLRRYLLCVLDADGDGMFQPPKTYEIPHEGDYTQYFLGVDAAYKGKDNICISLCSVDDTTRIEEVATIRKDHWIDGVTSEDIINDIVKIANKFHVACICVDVGQGIWLVEGLAKRGLNVYGINFAQKPTPERVRARHYSATNALNKRAEMHLDLQNLIDDGAILFSKQAYNSVKDTLPFVTSSRKSNGKIEIVKKTEIKAQLGRSPDELDAIILSIHAAILFLGSSLQAIV